MKLLRNPYVPGQRTKKSTYFYTVLNSVLTDAIRKKQKRDHHDSTSAELILEHHTNRWEEMLENGEIVYE